MLQIIIFVFLVPSCFQFVVGSFFRFSFSFKSFIATYRTVPLLCTGTGYCMMPTNEGTSKIQNLDDI